MFDKELEVALLAANSVQNTILEIYNSSNFNIEIKDDNSPVTRADKVSDAIIRKILKDNFPSYALLTEESEDDLSRLENDFAWIVDPVDGTKDFIAKNGEFTVNIGLSYKNEAVLGVVFIPVTGEFYFAVKGQGSFYKKTFDSDPIRIHVNNKKTDLLCLVSNNHFNKIEEEVINKHSDVIRAYKPVGAAIKGCLIAKGEAEISYRYSSNTKEWDTCAMQIILEEAGGFLLNFDKKPIKYNKRDVYNHDGYIMINNLDNYLL